MADIPITIDGCATIDGTTGDTYLEDIRKGLPHAKTHHTRDQAWLNLTHCCPSSNPGTGTVHILGHGYQGLIFTGSGQSLSDSQKHIGTDNHNAWSNQATLTAIGSGITRVRLCGCDTGAGSYGAQLVLWLANKVGVCVEAPTGRIFYHDSQPNKGFFLEAGATWQRANPEDPAPPAAIDPPNPYVTTPDMKEIVLGSPDGNFMIPVSAVTAISIRPSEFRKFEPVTFPPEKATTIQFDVPRELPGAAGGVITGTLVLAFVRNGRQEQRSFRIYNHRLLEDMTPPGYDYYANISELISLAKRE